MFKTCNYNDSVIVFHKYIVPLPQDFASWRFPLTLFVIMNKKTALSHSQEEFERLKDFDIVYLYLANNSPEDSWKNVIKEYQVVGDNVVHYNLPAEQQVAVENFLGV